MTTTRTTLRTQAVAELLGVTAAESRVYDSRKLPITARELEAGPVIIVWTEGEEADKRGPSRIWETTCPVMIAGFVKAANDPSAAAAADALLKQIEDALLGGPWSDIGRGVQSVSTSSGPDTLADGAGGLVGKAVLVATVAYRTEFIRPADPDVASLIAEVEVAGNADAPTFGFTSPEG